MSEDADRARRLLASCQMPGYDPEEAETYPAVEDGGVNSIGNALAAAQVLATLSVADELRRSNEDRDRFYATMLEFLEKVTADPFEAGDEPLCSEPPAAAPGCLVCGRVTGAEVCNSGDLTREQWTAHRNWFYSDRRKSGATKMQAENYAEGWMSDLFGPCPEES